MYVREREREAEEETELEKKKESKNVHRFFVVSYDLDARERTID